MHVHAWLCASLVVCYVLSAAAAAPSAPFEVIWNSQTRTKHGCLARHKVDVNVTQYGIVENASPRSNGWKGEKITIFYNHGFIWPSISRDEAQNWRSGGLPQLGNLTKFLEDYRDYINERIPDPDFSGIGVLDFEEWRPLYDMNFPSGSLGFIQEESKNVVRNEHAEWNEDEIATRAREDFDRAARSFMEGALLVARRMRPKARWGYYHYPHCFYGKRTDRPCADNSYEFNNRLKWMAEASDILFPSAYFMPSTGEERKRGWVFGNNDLADDWRRLINQKHKPIYHYNKYSIRMPIPFYTESDLIDSIGLAADQGIDGIVLWGNNYQHRDEQTCRSVQDYVNTKLGPYVRKILEFTQRCSADLCHSHGRCKKSNIDLGITPVDTSLDEDHSYTQERAALEYSCLCYEGWTGEACNVAEEGETTP